MVTDGESSNRDGAVFEAYNAKQEGIDIIALGMYYRQIDFRPVEPSLSSSFRSSFKDKPVAKLAFFY